MSITIRRATKGDWKIIQKLNNEVFEDNLAYDKYLDMDWPFSKEGIKHYTKSVSAPDHVTFIAFDGDKPVGHIVGGPKNISYRKVKTVEILEIGVSPGYRSIGIGSKLLTALRVWAKGQGYETLMVNSYYTNEKAIAFYKKQGLTLIDLNLETTV